MVSLVVVSIETPSSTSLVSISGALVSIVLSLISYSATEIWDISGVLVFTVFAGWLLLRRASPPPTAATRASVSRIRAGSRP